MNLYDVTVPVFDHFLGRLSHLLSVGAAAEIAQGIEPSILPTARLAPDMFSLAQQIYVATDTAKGCAFRLSGQDVPRWEDTEREFEELRNRIQRTRDLLSTFERASFEDAAERQVKLRFAGRDLSFDGLSYVNKLALPNFYFHASLAHGILRAKGVELGKFDFLGEM